MHIFQNPAGDGTIYFDNLLAPENIPVAYDPVAREFVAEALFCKNRELIGCNWVATGPDALCVSCAMTAMSPDASLPDAVENWGKTEEAKRWVLDNLRQWGWFTDTDTGARPIFHMLAEGVKPVVMGHHTGVVTINIDESDPVLRAERREDLGENYRTMIGHMRHEIAHMLWWRLSISTTFLTEFRALFGDEQADYGVALKKHYADGPPLDWQDSYLTPYASSHPHEDWAETTAHMLHLIDIADSFLATNLSAPHAPKGGWDPYKEPNGDKLTTFAAELTIKINHVNRSMGLADLYPFVLTDKSRKKLSFVHRWLFQGP
ncbi:hypothetical protein FHS72_001260 [Loktanella ponticola]|uniref:Zinc-binding metallo-peptidase n=1 Tax=Yoonia ponticola TaxID=1524255 RepID=A0A7W9BJE0_9RHOB|nr:putative zinc-binding metallopeptidase [Yoonia ponticola]MBB5721648.1 hypothetical protein [Yoonia ponticola]